MPLFLTVSEIYGRKVSKWWKIRIFFELFGPPCRNALADLDSSTPECAHVCAVYIALHLASLRKIEMAAVLCTNETTPQFFWVFNSPSPHPQWADGHHRERGHVGRHCPYTNNIWCGSVQALLRYRSKTAKMQKFPIDSHSNKNFISLFFRPPGPPTTKRGEDTFGTRVHPHAKFGVNWPAGCGEMVDKKTNKTAKVKQIPRLSL